MAANLDAAGVKQLPHFCNTAGGAQSTLDTHSVINELIVEGVQYRFPNAKYPLQMDTTEQRAIVQYSMDLSNNMATTTKAVKTKTNKRVALKSMDTKADVNIDHSICSPKITYKLISSWKTQGNWTKGKQGYTQYTTTRKRNRAK